MDEDKDRTEEIEEEAERRLSGWWLFLLAMILAFAIAFMFSGRK